MLFPFSSAVPLSLRFCSWLVGMCTNRVYFGGGGKAAASPLSFPSHTSVSNFCALVFSSRLFSVGWRLVSLFSLSMSDFEMEHTSCFLLAIFRRFNNMHAFLPPSLPLPKRRPPRKRPRRQLQRQSPRLSLPKHPPSLPPSLLPSIHQFQRPSPR